MIGLAPNGGSEGRNTFSMLIYYDATHPNIYRVAFSSPIKIGLDPALRQERPATSLSFISDLRIKSGDGTLRIGEIFHQSIKTFVEYHLCI